MRTYRDRRHYACVNVKASETDDIQDVIHKFSCREFMEGVISNLWGDM
jgi:hypothetical protein